MTNDWTFFRRVAESEIHNFSALEQKTAEDGKIVVSGSDISLIFPNWIKEKENVLFVAPHDDDNHLGAGLLTQAATAYGGTPYFLVITDGRKGYYTAEDKATIYEKRVAENIGASAILGVPKERITRFDFPDGDLAHYNCIKTPNDKHGLHYKLTEAIRDIRATRVVVPTNNDAHPDHKYVNEALRICVFHAAVEIWEELGLPTQIKTMLESAIYCPFEQIPDCALSGPKNSFERKMKAIESFASQRQIKSLVEKVRQSGPVENFLTTTPPNYSANDTFNKYFSNGV